MAGQKHVTGRVAIVHDWFQGFHGSERVVDALVDAFGAQDIIADIYTFYAEPDVIPARLAQRVVKQSRVARLPIFRQTGHAAGRWRYLLPYMPRYFRGLRLDAYDVVIASSHACALHVRPGPSVPYIVYCHTPMRYAWMPDVDVRGNAVARLALRGLRGWLRRADAKAAQRPDRFVANSENVRVRIEQFYGRDSVVVHPPVDVDAFDPAQEKEPGRFLWVHRLVPYKRPEVVVDAFRTLPYRLTMVGVGPLDRALRAQLPPNVELRSWISRSELIALFNRSAGFIHVGEEDFGISLVEALAAGTPVIAIARGGAAEIVRAGVDGVLIEDATSAGVAKAAHEVSEREWDAAVLAERASAFSRERFIERFVGVVSEVAPAPAKLVGEDGAHSEAGRRRMA